MEEKVFLLSKRSKFRTDADVSLNVQLEADSRLIMNTDLGETLSLYDLYNEERDNSTKFRLIIDINPICTNALFNNVTEIVKYSGKTCYVVTKDRQDFSLEHIVNYTFATYGTCRHDMINDTEFSHSSFGNFIYRCGTDMFNNHILRSKDFVHIGKTDLDDGTKEATDGRTNFNTMADYQRDSDGNVISGNSYSDVSATANVKYHVYTLDGLDDLTTTFSDKCIEKDGWLGFENRTLIDIPNVTSDGSNYLINRVINNEKPCSFIDMYPGRDLFSFTPVYNEEKMRPERNWDYCLTYPYESDYDKFNEINENSINAIKVISAEITYGNSGEELIQFKTLIKHNLSRGSYVSLYYTEKTGDNAELTKVPFKVRVSAIGDAEGNDSDIIFRVRMRDVSSHFENDEGKVIVIGGRKCKFFFKKVAGSSECKYYFRKFKKIKYLKEEYSATTVPASEINKLALAKNIYGDNISQLIYTDDIDVSGLVDNLGMPLTKLYLTIVKANRGNVEWYENDDYNNDNVECSHAFGKVTSGIELPEDYYDYNIHKLHNINLEDFDKYENYSAGTRAVYSNFATQPKVLEGDDESGITMDKDDVFYGDIVEFNFAECDETILDYVYHRFNTKQREVCNPEYFDIYEDTLVFDDYYMSKGETPVETSAKAKANASTISSSSTTIKTGATVPTVTEYTGNTLERYDADLSDKPTITIGNTVSDNQKPYSEDERVSVSNLNIALVPGEDGTSSDKLYAGNLSPEGYYYKPHHEIVIREKSDDINEVSTNLINYSASDVKIYSGSTTYEYNDGTSSTDYFTEAIVKSPVDYGFKIGDIVIFYNMITDITNFGVIEGLNGTTLDVVINDVILSQDDIDSYSIMISHTEKTCPLYAKFSMQNQTLVWRDIVKPSERLSDSELYDTPFANGAFYVHKNINFFLRRQDPNGEYYMLNPEDDYRGVAGVTKKMRPFRIHSYGKVILDAIKYAEEYLKSDCM